MVEPLRTPGGGTLALIALVAFGAVGAALYTQHRLDMQPCPWCVLQRLIFVAIGSWALLGALVPARLARLVSALMVSLLAGCGVAAALWQHFVAAASASCNLTFADRVMNATGLNERFPEVFAAYASCADAAVDLAGIPYEFYSLALFIGLDVAALLFIIRTLRPR
jgi:protein dithiol:quinone oxidoreductase